MRFFFSFMRAPLWVKAIMIVLVVGGVLVVRDGRVPDMIKAQAQAAIETQAGQIIDQALADAAAAMGLESLDLFGAFEVGGAGASGVGSNGFVANNGHKSEKVQVDATPIDWRAEAEAYGRHLMAHPAQLFILVFSVILVLLVFKAIVGRIKRLFSAPDKDVQRKMKMETSIELPGFDLDSAFADPKAAPDMAAVIGKMQNTAAPGAKPSMRAGGKTPAKTVQKARVKMAKQRKQAQVFFTSRKPSALLKQKLDKDPFDKLPA